jgi:hypothetical protein
LEVDMLERTGAALGMAAILVTVGCGSVVEEQGSGTSSGSPAGSGGSSGTSGSGSSGTAGACPTGAQLATFGGGGSGATIGVATDASGVYWTVDQGEVWSAASGGTSLHGLIVGNRLYAPQQLYTIALDADSVYFVMYPGRLQRVGKDGSGLSSLTVGNIQATGLAADDGGVYLGSLGGVFRADKQGQGATLLAPVEDADSLALDADFVYVRTVGNTGDPTNRLVRVPRAGGAPQDIAPPEPGGLHYFSQEIAVDATSVYWVNPSQGTVAKVAKGGGAPEVLAAGLADPVSLALSDGFVYVTVRGKDGGSGADRAVVKVPATGGPVTYVAHGPSTSAYGLALDATRAYWTQKVEGGGVSTACK